MKDNCKKLLFRKIKLEVKSCLLYFRAKYFTFQVKALKKSAFCYESATEQRLTLINIKQQVSGQVQQSELALATTSETTAKITQHIWNHS